jgi:hypothetical protein
VPVQIKRKKNCEAEMTLAAPFSAYMAQIIGSSGGIVFARWSVPTGSFSFLLVVVATSLSCPLIFL